MGYIATLAQNAHASLSAGYGTFGYEPKVNYFYGIPTSIEPGTVALDIPWSMVSHVSDGDMEKRKQYNLQWGSIGSALEHAVPEQMFQALEPKDQQPAAISAVKALQMASTQGQQIYRITRENMDVALQNIRHDGKSEIQAALQEGLMVITHADSVSVPGWSGGGYIILDPEDFTGSYKISGGSNGGLMALTFFATMAIMVIIVSPTVSPIFVYMLAALVVVHLVLATIYDFDFGTYNDNTDYIEGTTKVTLLTRFSRVADLLGTKSLKGKVLLMWIAVLSATFYLKGLYKAD